jgi:DNA helicase-2/ATP-dependent DNA helicase PcrA
VRVDEDKKMKLEGEAPELTKFMKSNIQSIYTLLDEDSRLTNGNLQIIACAGAGKTEFISARVAYLIAKKMAKPENIVAFTFTERAAKELKFRIRSKIREFIGHQPDIGDLYVGTIRDKERPE